MAEAPDRSIMLTHTSRPWGQRLHFHLVDHGGGILAGYALSAADVLRAGPDVIYLDDVCSFATRQFVADLAKRSITVVGVFEASEGSAGRRRLADLGIDHQVEQDAPVHAFLSVLDDAGKGRPSSGAPTPSPESSERTGRIVAVAAAAGGAGATEVSAALAWSTARRAPVVLADVDENTPSVAARLGLPLHPNLTNAVRALEDQASLEGVLHVGERSRLAILTGSNRGFDRRIGADDATAVLDRLAGSRHVVANCGSRTESCHSAQTVSQSDVTRAVLGAADAVVLVAVAGPVGILRLAEWLDEGTRIVEPARLHLVMNRFPGGGFRSDELLREMRSLVDAASIRILPHDARVDRAAWRGRHVGRGAFARRTGRLARDLFSARFPVRG